MSNAASHNGSETMAAWKMRLILAGVRLEATAKALDVERPAKLVDGEELVPTDGLLVFCTEYDVNLDWLFSFPGRDGFEEGAS